MNVIQKEKSNRSGVKGLALTVTIQSQITSEIQLGVVSSSLAPNRKALNPAGQEK